MSRMLAWGVTLALCFIAAAMTLAPQGPKHVATPPIKWSDCLRQRPEWYGGDEAIRIADNVLLYQRDAGGWPKNIDMAAALTEREKAGLLAQKRKTDATIDNGGTYTQIAYLAKVYGARGLERHRAALLRGVDYLLEAQYENGGWPQNYPAPSGYHKRITFNDGAMIGVLNVLREIAERRPAYAFVDEDRRLRAAEAVRRGVECILKTQIAVEGKRTAWCAQYDEVTLAPAPARSYEPASLSGGESVGIVRFLMGIERPDGRVVEAINGAIEWFERSKIGGIRVVEKRDGPDRPERVVVTDPDAGPLWARFYEIGTNRPVFAGRDGVIRYSLAEIEAERRNNYDWYTDAPARLLREDYPSWRKRVSGL